MARRMIGPSTRRARAVRDDRFRRRGTPSHDRLPNGRGAAYSAHNWLLSATGYGVRSGALPCKIPSAVGGAGGRRYRQNIDRQARRRPAERPLSDCMSSTAASREILLVRCCVLASVTTLALSGDRLLDWSLDDLNFVL